MSEKKNKGGRPARVLNDDELAQVEALAAFLTVEQISDYLGIGKTTFYEIMGRQPELSERYKRGKSAAIGKIAQSLVQKAAGGDTTCMIFYLKTQAGWKESMDITNSDGSMTPTVIELVSVDESTG